jgi:hypothetical protein
MSGAKSKVVGGAGPGQGHQHPPPDSGQMTPVHGDIQEAGTKQGPLVQDSLVPLLKYLSIRDPEV